MRQMTAAMRFFPLTFALTAPIQRSFPSFLRFRAPLVADFPLTVAVRILAIETIGATGSAAALEGADLRLEIELRPDQRSAQSLAPALDQLLREMHWQPSDVSVVAVLTGPGSFTGLRVGVTTAKVFSRVVQAAIVGIGSLETCVAQIDSAVAERCWAVIDAGRQQQFAASFVRGADGTNTARGSTASALAMLSSWTVERPPAIVDNAALAEWLRPGDLLTGPGLSVLAASLSAEVRQADRSLWQPRAATVGRLAALRFASGGADDVLAITPDYLRHSAAEEKWLARQAENAGELQC